MTLIDTAAAQKARAQAPFGASQADQEATARAAALDSQLASIPTLEQRLQAIAAAVPGRIAFSSSLGIEDQAVTHAIAATGVSFDVFTLDTGRHFPETLDTLFETEARYGMRVRVVFPEASDVEKLVAEDGIMGFRYSVEARKACCDVRKVRPSTRRLRVRLPGSRGCAASRARGARTYRSRSTTRT